MSLRTVYRGFFCLGLFFITFGAAAQPSFVNFETPHVNPIDLSPGGTTLAVCNTPDNRVELFSVSAAGLQHIADVPVGLDPVSVRFRTNNELWVANQISDSVSIVDVPTQSVKATLTTRSNIAPNLLLDEPADIAFAGTPQRAFITYSQSNTVAVYNPNNLFAAPTLIDIKGEDPRAMAVSPDGNHVYVAIFESGNGTTILAGGGADLDVVSFPPNVVSDRSTPYAGQNPPPNDGANFDPPRPPGQPIPPRVGLIVRQGEDGRWRDDNGTDWTEWVSGPEAHRSGRPVGWTLIDNDVARINANTLNVDYATKMMNIVMDIAVNPATGGVTVVGTDAINETRFEPVVNGIFVRVKLGMVDNNLNTSVTDLNPHLTYETSSIPPQERFDSIGDPRGIVWNSEGDRGYVTGMGSNNLIVIDADGNRVEELPIPLPEGPTGLVLDEAHDRLYVLSKFAAEVTTVNLQSTTPAQSVALYDPTPEPIKTGRKHLYNTQKNSGLGQASCGSCHVDARMDRLAWDLGDPSLTPKALNDDENPQNLGARLPGLSPQDPLLGTTSFQPWHPMKGPMTTQTMQDIIGQEPHHWRGDRDGLEEFNPAFEVLLGGTEISANEMQEFEDFLATIYYPPNPFRNLDNSLPTNLPVGDLGHFATGAHDLPAGAQLPNGNAQRGLRLYRDFERPLDRSVFACVICHTLPTGAGTNAVYNVQNNPLAFFLRDFSELPPGKDGEMRHALVSVDGSTNRSIKIAQLRNLYEKVGCEFTRTESMAGFGFLHDGSVDSLARFVTEDAFDVRSDQETADLVALMLAFSGSDFGPPPAMDVDAIFQRLGLDPLGLGNRVIEPPGTPSKDAHAAVGRQFTYTNPEQFGDGGPLQSIFDTFFAELQRGRIELVAKQLGESGDVRGYAWHFVNGALQFDSDSASDFSSAAGVLFNATPQQPVTLTAVPVGTAHRIGVDRDEDGFLDFDETRDLDPFTEGIQNPFNPAGPNNNDGADEFATDGDADGDGIANQAELDAGLSPILDDSDNDGLKDDQEIAEQTDPLNPDTDEDDIPDGTEVMDLDPSKDGIQNPFDPLGPDSTGDDGLLVGDGVTDGENDFDGDGRSNAQEVADGTNPIIPDDAQPADIDRDGSVNAVDVQIVINAALGLNVNGMPTDVDGQNGTNAVDVQMVINAALGLS